ncbi:MAG: class I SAM-dependent methyltransferase [Planctomycetota bacterium]|nr:class I SAM-dependent methyltransferase [Planctomycetota bacterium]
MTHRCPVCSGSGLEVFFELAGVPTHCNVLHETEQSARSAPRGDIRLGFCRACGMIRNVAFDPARMEYGAAYENALHGSARFRRYAEDLAAQLRQRHGLDEARIVEIGCGDGHFLRLLCRGPGNRGWGFDPACAAGSDGAVALVAEPFTAGGVAGSVDFVACRHVLEHIESPAAFLDEVRRAAPDATLYFEVPDARWTLERGGIWDVLYEHCSYFTPASLARLFTGAGLIVTRTGSAFGGQFLQLEAAPAGAATTQAPPENVAECARRVDSFRADYDEKASRWRERLGELRATGRRVALWGAGTKGVMFLNCVDTDRQAACVVDINAKKQGMHVAGTGQRIVAPDALAEFRPDVVLVMNPNYRDEIGARLDDLGVRAELEAA